MLGGCALLGSDPKEVEIRTVSVEKEVYQPPRPAGTNLLVPKFYVVTEDNLDEFLAEIRRLQDAMPTFFAFTPKGYEAMSFNVQELRRLILEYKNLVEYYETNTKASKDSNDLKEKEVD